MTSAQKNIPISRCDYDPNTKILTYETYLWGVERTDYINTSTLIVNGINQSVVFYYTRCFMHGKLLIYVYGGAHTIDNFDDAKDIEVHVVFKYD